MTWKYLYFYKRNFCFHKRKKDDYFIEYFKIVEKMWPILKKQVFYFYSIVWFINIFKPREYIFVVRAFLRNSVQRDSMHSIIPVSTHLIHFSHIHSSFSATVFFFHCFSWNRPRTKKDNTRSKRATILSITIAKTREDKSSLINNEK